MVDRIAMAVILAGGEARRLGGDDKARIALNGKPLIRHVIDAVTPQARAVTISCHDQPERFADLALPVIADEFAERLGPIGGILSALDYAATHDPQAEFILSVPTDTPFLPDDLVRRLKHARQIADLNMACACSGDQIHPVIALWPVGIRTILRRSLERAPERNVRNWARRIGCAYAIWPNDPVDPFFNINTPDDLATASARTDRNFRDRVTQLRPAAQFKSAIGGA